MIKGITKTESKKEKVRSKKCGRKFLHRQKFLHSFFLFTSYFFLGGVLTLFPLTAQNAATNDEFIPDNQAPPPSKAEQIMKAFAAGYPGRIGKAVERNGDWAVPVFGVYFYYAGGRLLPESLRPREKSYDPQPFYDYPKEQPPWRRPTPKEAAQMQRWHQERDKKPPRRCQLFFDALWRAHSRNEAYSRLKTIIFLGHKVEVHYAIMEELALVEQDIQDAAKKSPRVRTWLKGLTNVTCWNWRNVADTESRSFHAYGAAVDLQMAPQKNQYSYWLWAAQARADWWNTPYSQRQQPPPEVVRAFEHHGFCWGGKWPLFDTMHFEFRPEILIYNGLPLRLAD
jgi:hypothetical protein